MSYKINICTGLNKSQRKKKRTSLCLADAEQAGYEFEMGRQRALKELREDEEMMKTIGPLS